MYHNSPLPLKGKKYNKNENNVIKYTLKQNNKNKINKDANYKLVI